MTVPSRSVLDEYLPGYARERGFGPRRAITVSELPDVLRRIDRCRYQPRGLRQAALDAIADDYGVTRRTLYRYAACEARIVEVDGWRAAFVKGRGGPPMQVTSWERAA